MNKLNKESIRKELVSTKDEMKASFDKELSRIVITKEELQDLKDKLKGHPDYVVEREVKYYHILKKLGVVEQEAQLITRLDNAITFLDYLIDKKVA